MKRYISRIYPNSRIAKETYRVRPSHAKTIVFFPFIIVSLWFLFIVLPSTRLTALWMLKENHPVELFTFCFCSLVGLKDWYWFGIQGNVESGGLYMVFMQYSQLAFSSQQWKKLHGASGSSVSRHIHS